MIGCYVGIDIGTTNTKAIILRADGKVAGPLKEKTPFRSRHGAVFFDLSRLEEIIIAFKREIQKQYNIRGISFSSVGESVVPVRNGKALSDPLFWNDPVTENIAKKMPVNCEECNPEINRHGKTNPSLSIYKIIWMRENLGIEEPDHWLSIPGYFVYRFTGKPCCDYTQGTRTLLMDIEKFCWHGGLLHNFNLENKLPPLGEMDACIGEDRENIVYAAGGHDHIAGLFCIDTMVNGRPFIFDSIGSSETVITLTNSRTGSGQICIGAFRQGRFYALDFIVYSGLLLESIAGLGGNVDVAGFLNTANEKLLKLDAVPNKTFPVITGGDPVTGPEKRNISLINLPITTDSALLVHAAYVYLATMARINLETLYSYTDPKAYIIAGGGGTTNKLYMQYRATICGGPVRIISAAEIGAIGASLCAAKASGDDKTIQAFRESQNFEVVQPVAEWRETLCRQSGELLDFYRDIKNKPLFELCS